jgi:hypothetical protein
VVLDIEFEFWDFDDLNPLYEEDDYSLRRWERTHNGWEPTNQGW